MTRTGALALRPGGGTAGPVVLRDRGRGLRVGFLLNHEGAHQAGHVLPVAAAMARDWPRVRVEAFVAPGHAEAEARRVLAAEGAMVTVLEGAGWFGRVVSDATGGSVPGRRVSVLRRNRDVFRGLDALVVPEKTSLMLRDRFGLEGVPMVHTRHGAGDRAVGFDRASGRFDLVLLSGRKIRDRLEAAGLLGADGAAIVGYPKFDRALGAGEPRERLFDNDRPTVLYNPHCSRRLSSWFAIGPAVLDHFARQREYNLIFAPHVMLFARRFQVGLSPFGVSRPPRVPAGVAGLPHVRVDLGSRASVDMTYTRAADIYLGDASSQVYEFLARPRPCVFLNPRRLRWRGDPSFAHWTTGPVVRGVEGLPTAFERAERDRADYARVQRELFDYSLDLTAEPSSRRAARAIVEWLDRRTP